MSNTLGIVIFSKDRACQLHALLTSLQDHLKIPADIQVIHTSSTESFREGYNLLKDIFSDPDGIAPHFVEQVTFRENVMNILRGFLDKERRHLMFMVDDMVMVRPFSESSALDQLDTDKSLFAISTRLGRNITRCYALNADTPVPAITDGLWSWRGGHGDWGYAYSVDANIYRLQEVYDLFFQHGFTCPSEVEGVLCYHPFDRPRMFCFESPKVINIPANIVQTAFPNNRTAGTYTTTELNKRYLDGEEINVEDLYTGSVSANTCHVPLKYTFISR